MSMSDKRFEKWNDHSCKVKDNQENTLLNWEDVVQKLNEQQAIIEQLYLAIDDLLSHTSCDEIKKENEQLRKDVENLQEVVAELGATLLVNGFEIEINGENLSELIDDE